MSGFVGSTLRLRALAFLQATLIVGSIMLPALAAAATIQTDLWVYRDGDTVTVTGIEYGAHEVVDFVTTDPDGVVVDTGSASTDEAGNVTYAFTLHATVGGIYDVIGTGETSGLVAATQFDPLGVTITSAAFVWYTGAFTLNLAGDYTCSGATGASACNDADSIDIGVFPSNGSNNSVAGVAVATKALDVSTTGAGVPWSTSIAFPADFAIPADGKYDVRAVFSGKLDIATRISTTVADDYFGIDTNPPTSAVTSVTGSAASVAASGTASDPAGGSGLNSGTPKPVAIEIRSSSCSGATFPDSEGTSNASGGTWAYTAPARPSAPGTYYVVSRATDIAGNVQSVAGCMSYTITSANTPPVLTVPSSPVVEEATSSSGAVVNFVVTATDTEDDPDPTPSCSQASGTTFPIGDTTVNCSVTDSGGLTDLDSFVVTVQDTTAPAVSVSTAESNGGFGWYNIASNDLVAGLTIDVTVSDLVGVTSLICTDTAGSVGPLTATGDSFVVGDGGHFIVCTASDSAGNSDSDVASFDVDQTAPDVQLYLDRASAVSGWFNENTGGPVAQFTCSDATSGVESCPIDHAFGEGADQLHSDTGYDRAGNSASASISDVDVDLTDPTITWIGTIADGASYYFGFVPATSTCEAADDLSGPDGCDVTGYGSTVGSHTLTATAEDVAGNSYQETRTYTVLAWTLSGFYQPVDMNHLNIVKGGSTVPLKFEMFAGSNELASTSYVKSFKSASVDCDFVGDLPSDVIDITTTGGTSLRYDSTSGQFIQNWQTPKKPGLCYAVTMTALDDSTMTAVFKLK